MKCSTAYERVGHALAVSCERQHVIRAGDGGGKRDAGTVHTPQRADVVTSASETLKTSAPDVEYPDVARARASADAHRHALAVG